MWLGLMSVKERNSVLEKCHDILWNGGALDPLSAWEQLVMILLVWKNLENGHKSESEVSELAHEVAEKIDAMVTHERGNLNFGIRKSNESQVVQGMRIIKDIPPNEIGSAAAKEVMLSGFLRHGLGQYFTPLFARNLIVSMIPPSPGMKVGDYCMGTGGFLRAALEHEPDIQIFGCDISENLWKLVTAEFNYINSFNGHFANVDSLLKWDCSKYEKHDWLQPDFLDRAYTNPPFGFKDCSEDILDNFVLGKGRKKQTTEALLLERHIQSLAPGGMLGIVLPDSIASNFGTMDVRKFILGLLGTTNTLKAVISLPTHTFHHSDTCTQASIFIIENSPPPASHDVFMAKLEHVGYDSRGNECESQVDEVLERWHSFVKNGYFEEDDLAFTRKSTDLDDRMTPSRLRQLRVPKGWVTDSISSICSEEPRSGRTAGKKDYDSTGCKLLKVRDLTGKGIDWSRDDKGRVSDTFFDRSNKGHLQEGDIVIITAAHHRGYIGKDIDMIENIPDEYVGRLMCVGEIMRIRVDPEKIEPRFVLNWLRTKQAYQAIQDSIRGQTAHLYPIDVGKIEIPFPPNMNEMIRFQQIFDSQVDAQRRKSEAVTDSASATKAFIQLWDDLA